MGKLLCEKNLRDVWCRNEGVRAEIGQILHTHTHTRVSYSSIDAYNFKALSILFAKLLDFKVWNKLYPTQFLLTKGPTMCHGNNFNSKTIWSRNVKFWICSYG